LNAREVIDRLFEGSTLPLLHFSYAPNLKKVDPKFQGKAQAGQERGSRDYRKPAFSHWYVQSADSYIEPIFWNTYVYSSQVNLADLNDQTVENLPNDEAKRQGYKGVYYHFKPGDEQVRLFVPASVQLLGKLKVPMGKKFGQITGANLTKYIFEPTFESAESIVDVLLEASSLPVLVLDKVYHVGTMKLKHRRDFSYEGSGLSVSLHPSAWTKIAKLGGNQTWELAKKGGKFIDALKMKKSHWSVATEWGVAQRLVEKTTVWRSWTLDGETDRWGYSMHATEEEARAEIDGFDEEEGRVDSVAHFKPTSKLTKGQKRKSSFAEVKDHLLVAYAEDRGYDGVWWTEDLDVDAYSAPRGVIVTSKISSWKAAPTEYREEEPEE